MLPVLEKFSVKQRGINAFEGGCCMNPIEPSHSCQRDMVSVMTKLIIKNQA